MNRIKTTILFAVFILGIIGLPKAYCQENTDVSEYNIIKWDPFSVALGTLTFAYERVLNDHLSLEGTLNMTGASVSVTNANSTIKGKESIAVFGIVPELRYYPVYKKRSAPRGFFVGPFFRYQAGNVKGQDSLGNSIQISGSRFSVGADFGYQFIFSHAISLEAFIGPEYDNISLTSTVSEPTVNVFNYNYKSEGVSGVNFRYGITVGVAF